MKVVLQNHSHSNTRVEYDACALFCRFWHMKIPVTRHENYAWSVRNRIFKNKFKKQFYHRFRSLYIFSYVFVSVCVCVCLRVCVGWKRSTNWLELIEFCYVFVVVVCVGVGGVAVIAVLLASTSRFTWRWFCYIVFLILSFVLFFFKFQIVMFLKFLVRRPSQLRAMLLRSTRLCSLVVHLSVCPSSLPFTKPPARSILLRSCGLFCNISISLSLAHFLFISSHFNRILMLILALYIANIFNAKLVPICVHIYMSIGSIYSPANHFTILTRFSFVCLFLFILFFVFSNYSHNIQLNRANCTRSCCFCFCCCCSCCCC